MDNIRWEFYPLVAENPHTRTWLETQMLLGLAQSCTGYFAHPLFKNLFDRQQQDVLAVGADEDKQEPDGLKIGRVLHNYSSGSSVFREDRLDGGLEV
jgi:hypothetical protein